MSNKCWKCKNHKGTCYHAWWTCDKARKYCVEIHMWIKQMSKQEMEFKPEIFLLGLLPNNINTRFDSSQISMGTGLEGGKATKGQHDHLKNSRMGRNGQTNKEIKRTRKINFLPKLEFIL